LGKHSPPTTWLVKLCATLGGGRSSGVLPNCRKSKRMANTMCDVSAGGCPGGISWPWLTAAV
jgi:hypothetical protein